MGNLLLFSLWNSVLDVGVTSVCHVTLKNIDFKSSLDNGGTFCVLDILFLYGTPSVW